MPQRVGKTILKSRGNEYIPALASKRGRDKAKLMGRIVANLAGKSSPTPSQGE